MSENYETHVTRLWFDNDPQMYADLREATEDLSGSPWRLARWIKEYVETMAEDADLGIGLVADLFNGAQSEIDYDAIARNAIETYAEKTE